MNRKNLLLPLFISIILLIMALLTVNFTLFGSDNRRTPEIYYGADKCRFCGMVISIKEFSAAYYSVGEEEWMKFDDIGCMLTSLLSEESGNIKYVYVRDYYDGSWVPAEEAYYVLVDPHDFKTPMGTGIAAFKDKNLAEKFSLKNNGRLFVYEEILNWFREHPVMPMQMG